MKKSIFLLPFMLLASSLAGCNAKQIVIGILQPVEHAALGAAREGFEEAIRAELPNVKFDYRNAGGNDASLVTLAKDLIDTSALTLGIGTGASQQLQGAAKNAGSSKPILFTAVTDPVDAKLVASKDNPDGNICGTTDANPVEEQIGLVKEFKADASKVGIIYTATETNSKAQSDLAEAAIKAAGMTSVVKTCTNSSDISATATALADSGVDAIFVPTDNNIAANMNAIKSAVSKKHILVVAGEEGILKEGGHISLSIDYHVLGVGTGKMAVAILKGEKKPTDFKVEAVPAENCSFVFSSANLADAGLHMPEAMLKAHSWTDVSVA